MKRYSIFLTLLFTCWSGFLFAAETKRPNVLMICVDDLKPVLGCYGDRTVKSPNIDRLAKRGMRFDRAYCNQAVCAPSRNTLMTGARPTTLGIYNLGTNFRQSVPDAVTLTQYFMRHGWRAEGIGKIFHVGHGNHEDAASWSVPHLHEKVVDYALPQSTDKDQITREEAYFSNTRLDEIKHLPRGAAYEIADVPDNAYADGRIADEAILRLRAAKEKPDEPLFLALGFVKPHLPFCAPKKYWDLYDREQFSLPERRTPPDGAPSYAPQFGFELRQYAGTPEKGDLPEDLQRTLIHGYHATVSYMDAQLGRVLDELDRLKLSDNTIILLWGDHGWHLGDHGMWCKHTNYEEANRIPFIIAAPGVTKKGSHSSALTETVDIYPTLCELAGLPKPNVPQQLDGTSLLPVLRKPKATVKDHVLHVFPRGPRLGRAIRTERYRLVEWKLVGAPAESADLELYDYKKDPGETKNLAAENPKVVKELRAMLATHPEAKRPIEAKSAPAPRPPEGASKK
ncbi:MAG: sulfatase [Verrucomicrobia bacterium]|nr:sulfatase [Verrucomicrobiota bacterium]